MQGILNNKSKIPKIKRWSVKSLKKKQKIFFFSRPDPTPLQDVFKLQKQQVKLHANSHEAKQVQAQPGLRQYIL